MSYDSTIERIKWKSEDTFELDGVRFRLVTWDDWDFPKHTSANNDFVLLKNKEFIEAYRRIFKNFKPNSIVEFGVYDGGSTVFLHKVFQPKKIIAIDLRQDAPFLRQYISDNSLSNNIYLNFLINQADETSVKKILNGHFKTGSVDLIINDASHQFEYIRSAFNASFPFVKQGGMYVIEDWGWAHWPGIWQESLGVDQPAMTNFIFEIVMAAATSHDIIEEIIIDCFYVAIIKGPREIKVDQDFRIQDLYLNRGRKVDIFAIREKDEHIQNIESLLKEKEAALVQKDHHLQSILSRLQEKEITLDSIYKSRGWKALLIYYRVRDKILSPNTKRRLFVKIVFKIVLEPTKVFRSIKKTNLKKFIYYFKNVYSETRRRAIYDIWILKNEPTKEKLKEQIQLSKGFDYKPKISIITPVWNTDKKMLIQMIESVINQTYDNWEICLVDGNSSKSYIKEILNNYASKDSRIKVKFLNENEGIAGNSNEALLMATGDFIGFLDHDDELVPWALYEVLKLLNENQSIDFIYSDEDKISVRGKRFDPHFKLDWSPDTLRSYNYITHFAVIRKKIIDEAGGFREGYEGSQDYDLFLRVVERTQRITHIPRVLYHWRSHLSSAASNPGAKMYACNSAKRALKDHINRMGLDGEVYDGLFLTSYRIKYCIDGSPMVSIIIPTKEKVDILKRCVTSILQKSSYKNYRVFIVDNQSIEAETFNYYKELKNESKIKILNYDKPFNFSAINNYGISQIDSEYVIFLNNDTEIISSNWIEAMLEFAQRRDVGAVGALLYYPNDTIQHAGAILGVGGVAGHSHKYFLRNDLGYMGRAKVIQNLSAVTAACLMTRKEVFYKIGGFSEDYSHAFNDVDFCLKIRERGYLIVYTPYAELYHYESLSRGHEDTIEKQERFKKEIEYFQIKWMDVLTKGDPYYNPNLTLDREDFSIRI